MKRNCAKVIWVVLSFLGFTSASLAQNENHPIVEAFEKACLQSLTFADQSSAFKEMGWSSAPIELEQYLKQDLIEPEESARFAQEIPGGGKYLASVILGSKGAWPFIRQHTHCFVRMWVEDIRAARSDLRKKIAEKPTDTIDNTEVSSDSWFYPADGKVLAFRAIKTEQGIQMVTISHFSKVKK